MTIAQRVWPGLARRAPAHSLNLRASRIFPDENGSPATTHPSRRHDVVLTLKTMQDSRVEPHSG